MKIIINIVEDWSHNNEILHMKNFIVLELIYMKTAKFCFE